jgi:hypothetical protein
MPASLTFERKRRSFTHVFVTLAIIDRFCHSRPAAADERFAGWTVPPTLNRVA